MTSPFATQRLTSTLPAQTADTEADQIVGAVRSAGRVTRCTFTPEAAITGDDTNSRTFTLKNKGGDGQSDTTVATLAYATGVDGVAFAPNEFTLAATEADRDVAEGDVLVVEETTPGTGLANPGGRIEVEISPTYG